MFRKLTTADAPFLEKFDAQLPETPLHRSREEHRHFLSQPTALAYAWEKDGSIMAYVLFLHATDSADLCFIATQEASRGQGLATQLLQSVLPTLAAEGIGEVFLEVRVGNRAAEKLYHRLGAIQVGLRPDYYSLAGGGQADARVLRLFTTT